MNVMPDATRGNDFGAFSFSHDCLVTWSILRMFIVSPSTAMTIRVRTTTTLQCVQITGWKIQDWRLVSGRGKRRNCIRRLCLRS